MNKMRLKMESRSHRYNLNRPRPRHGHKYAQICSNMLKYANILRTIMVICINPFMTEAVII